jgi:Tfp pilus assembly protein PilO
MNQRKAWIGIGVGGGLAALGFIGLIHMQNQNIDRAREEVAVINGQINDARKLVEGTATLEREVIVLRELAETMKKILPDTDDVNNLVRTLQRFSEESGVRISGLKKKTTPVNAQDKSDFDNVAYTLSLQADAFQMLDFFDLIEGHSRFMRIPSFKVEATRREAFEKEGIASHKIQVDVETFVYEPKNDAPPVRIDGYERKRDLLMGEVNRRRQSLTVSTYEYRGQRGRRDPWIDPRVPVLGEDGSALTVQEQMDIVQDMSDRMQVVLEKWNEVQTADNVIVEMMARADLEQKLVALEEDVRRVTTEGSIRYVPSERRMQIEVIDPIAALREQLLAESGRGPSADMLKEILKSMERHQARAEYDLMLSAYSGIEDRLGLVEADPLRKPLVDRLRKLAFEAQTVIDFEQIDIDVDGLAIIEGMAPVAVINGRSVGVGDMLTDELVIHSIHTGEIEFIFRGVILALSF